MFMKEYEHAANFHVFDAAFYQGNNVNKHRHDKNLPFHNIYKVNSTNI